MALVTREMMDFLDRQRLGYVATVSPDKKPNISPKGTIMAWDESRLIFADIRSPDTIRNLRYNPQIEINVIDPVLRRGYLFEGTAKVIEESRLLAEALKRYREMGVKSRIKAVVMVDVSSVSDVLSPLYDFGVTEDELRDRWTARQQQ